MHRFYVPDYSPDRATVEFSPAQARQIVRVLRLRAGDRLEVFDGRGLVSEAELTAVGPRGVTARAGGSRYVDWPFPWRAVLHLSLIRPQRFEQAVEQATELGAWRIVPLICARTAHGGEGVGVARRARWQQIAVEAAEQCGAAFVPDVRPVVPISAALREPAHLRLVASVDRDAAPGSAVSAALIAARPWPAAADPPEVAIYIGPEGGFEQAELQAAIAAGCHPVTLGPRILRAETAAAAALAMLIAAADTMGRRRVSD